ncbi:MAG: hypothetical protein HY454_00210 [Parcubacteria group bacterium]|nr:hypothetical protein [Parcubacteria group bacterium]
MYYLSGIVVLSSLLVCAGLILSLPTTLTGFKTIPTAEFVAQLLRGIAGSIMNVAIMGFPVMLVFVFFLKLTGKRLRQESPLSSMLIGGFILAAIVPVCYGTAFVLDVIEKSVLPPHIPFQQTLLEMVLGIFKAFFVEIPLSAYIVLEGFFFELLHLHKPVVVGVWFWIGVIVSKTFAIVVLASIGGFAGYLLHFVQYVLWPRNPPYTS